MVGIRDVRIEAEVGGMRLLALKKEGCHKPKNTNPPHSPFYSLTIIFFVLFLSDISCC